MGHLLDFLKGFFGGVWHFLLDYVHVAIPDSTAIIMKDLLPIADTVVADLNNKDMSGSQKRDAAFNAITSRIATIGLEVAGHLIYLAIEMAYTKLISIATHPAPAGNGGVLSGGNQSGG